LGAIVALLIVGALGGSNNDAPSDSSSTTFTDTTDVDSEGIEDLITAEMIVDVMPANQVTQFCDGYDLVGDYDLAFAAFKQGYTEADPSPEDVFDELLSRC
jgi:hypothetical protein